MGTEHAFDVEDTQPGRCGCAACMRRDELAEALKALPVTRVTTIYSRSAEAAGRDAYTTYIAVHDRVTATGQGASEEEALHNALERMGVIT